MWPEQSEGERVVGGEEGVEQLARGLLGCSKDLGFYLEREDTCWEFGAWMATMRRGDGGEKTAEVAGTATQPGGVSTEEALGAAP